MIIWTGKTTNKAITYTVEAETHKELLDKLIDRDIIDYYGTFGGDFFEALKYTFPLLSSIEALLFVSDIEINSRDTFIDEFDWEKEVFSRMTREDWEYTISSCKGQAYYQEFDYSVEE